MGPSVRALKGPKSGWPRVQGEGQAVEGVPSPVMPPCLGLGKGKTEAKTTTKDYAQGWRLSRCYQCHEVKFCVRLEVHSLSFIKNAYKERFS